MLAARGASYVLLFLAQAVVVCLLSEAVAQWFGFGRRIEYDSSVAVLWQPRPTQRVYNNRTNAAVTIDQWGLRPSPSTAEASERRTTVLALGDSVTFGYGLADDETYPARLQSHLDVVEPGQWRVTNAGVNGYNFFLAKQRLVFLREQGFKSDLLVIGFCFNESPAWPGEHFSDEEKAAIVRGVGSKNALRRSALFNYATEVVGPGVFFGVRNALMPRGSEDSLAGVSADAWLARYRGRIAALFEEARRQELPFMVIVWPYRTGIRGPYQETLLDECAKRDIACLDLNPLVKDPDTSPMFFDTEHPRADMVQRYMERIGPFFRSNARRLLANTPKAPR